MTKTHTLNTQKTTKPVSKIQTKTTQNKTTSTVKKPVQNQQQTKPNTVVQQKTPQQQKTTVQTNQNTQQTTQSNIQNQIKPIDTTISKQQAEQELKNYKKSIQSVFASRIKGNLLQVYGDGSCVVDFKVDSKGKFINRSFSQQSTNNTLNDAVYQAVMSIPSYNAPPASYKGQTLHLSVKITNGMAQISVY